MFFKPRALVNKVPLYQRLVVERVEKQVLVICHDKDEVWFAPAIESIFIWVVSVAPDAVT